MRQRYLPVYRHLGRLIGRELTPITQEPLPERWVDLINHLNELERQAHGEQRSDAYQRAHAEKPRSDRRSQN